MPEQKKRCRKCKKDLSLDGFCKDRSRNDGLANVCKICEAPRSKARNAANTAANKLARYNLPPKPPATDQLCWMCERIKLIAEFYKDRSSTTGHARCCKDCQAIRLKGWRSNGYVEYKRRRKLEGRDGTKALSDPYIRQLLAKRSSLKSSDITGELVTLKRLQVQIQRTLKEMTNEKC